MRVWCQDTLKPEHIVLVNTDKVRVVRVATINKKMPGWQAMARIAAAAPDLLTELRAATRLMANQQSDEYGPRENWPAREQIERQEAAIAAAEGAKP